MRFKNFVFPFFLIFIISSCTDDNLTPFVEDNENEFFNDNSITKRSCGQVQHMENLLLDPAYREKHADKISKLEIELSKAEIRNCNAPVIIPVAVHFQNVTGTNASCLAQLVESQISVLNKDISGTNNDIAKWTSQAASFFPGINNGETCVKFCVATKNHPVGYSLSNGQPAITVNKTNGDRVNAWSGYLNIFVRPNLGFLGEAPLGGSGNGDGVLIDASTFGLGAGCGNVRPQAPYNLGRTTTHEVGHYLFLDHIWGNGCGVDDDVEDTPDQSIDRGGCPNLGAKSCGSNDMHMNYMDYTNDVCMYMFSAGQSQRMQAYINGNLTSLINKASAVCGESVGTNPGGDTNESSLCSKVASSNVQILSSTQAKINWPNVSDALAYRIRYKKQGSSNWMPKTVTASQYTLTSLSANTTYLYQIRVKCPTGWTGFSTVKDFTTDTNNDGETDHDNSCNYNDISFHLVLDEYGSETSWELVRENGARVAVGGPYGDGQAGKLIIEYFCLADGCYTMYVDDEFGDGICCEYGNGKASIKNSKGQVIIRSNGKFGYFTYLDFCVSDGLARTFGERKDEPKTHLGRKIKSN